jgi:predicted patatin/cPLA2 family phospholipase
MALPQQLDAVAFAGGGNRCYWQGGFFETVMPRMGWSPPLASAVSAGAFVACYTALGRGSAVRAMVIEGCRQQKFNLDWKGFATGKPLFAVGPAYRTLIREGLGPDAVARLSAVRDIQVAIARVPSGWPAVLAAPVGIIAYEREKKRSNPVHPQAGRKLGFVQEFVAAGVQRDDDALTALLMASASVPPVTPIGRVGGRAALDGGLVDNVPVHPLEAIEATGGKTLVLLTRQYPALPVVEGRIYIQPSQRIGVSQFSITDGDGIEAAYRLGVADGEAFLRRSGD